jgi:hypothetical protein
MKSVQRVTTEHNGASRRRPGLARSKMARINRDPLRPIAKRVHVTYLARLALAKRLQSRAVFWNGALVALSLSSLIGSIGLLLNSGLYGPNGRVIMVVIGVFLLVSSLMVANARYSSRSHAAFEVYRNMQRSSSFLWAHVYGSFVKKRKAARLRAEAELEYQRWLDQSENHSQGDYASAIRIRLRTRRRVESNRIAEVNGAEDHNSKLYPFGEFSVLWGHRVGRLIGTLMPCLLIIAAGLFALPTVFWMFGD